MFALLFLTCIITWIFFTKMRHIKYIGDNRNHKPYLNNQPLNII